jgi:hypothetical protein
VSLEGTLASGLEHEIAERDARRARGGQLLPRLDRTGPG